MLILWTAPVPGYLRLHHCIYYIVRFDKHIAVVMLMIMQLVINCTTAKGVNPGGDGGDISPPCFDMGGDNMSFIPPMF